MEPKQFRLKHVVAGDRKSAEAFNMKTRAIQPCSPFLNSGFKSEFGSCVEEYFVLDWTLHSGSLEELGGSYVIQRILSEGSKSRVAGDAMNLGKHDF